MPDARSPRYRAGRYRDYRGSGFGNRPGGSAGSILFVVAAAMLCLFIGGFVATKLLANGQTDEVPSASSTSASSTPSSPPRTAAGTETTADIVVRQGDTLADVAGQLQAAGVIRSAAVFRLDVRTHNLDATIQPGTYRLSSGMSTDDIVAALHKTALKPQVSVLFKEGWRTEEIGSALDAKGVLASADYLRAASSVGPYTKRYPFLAQEADTATLNGYLFPDTYNFDVPTPAGDVVDRQLARFNDVITPEMRAEASQHQHSLHDVLIIASIVEREAKAPSERPTIAGVYWNRLKDKEGLYADPTVQYALGWQPAANTWWKVLSVDDLKVNSPFNTYRVTGLPPGPICNPGLASIQAALNPEGDYKYMVAKNDGSGNHAFAKTLEEHNANVKKYQQAS